MPKLTILVPDEEPLKIAFDDQPEVTLLEVPDLVPPRLGFQQHGQRAVFGRRDIVDRVVKDVADSLAGVVYGLTWARYFWTIHGVSPTQAPDALRKISARVTRK